MNKVFNCENNVVNIVVFFTIVTMFVYIFSLLMVIYLVI
jgi:hypothetical protein